MATQDGPQDDEDLMHELRQAMQAREAVTQRARDAARGAYAWRTIDAELLALTHDAPADADALVRAPADGPAMRLLSFAGTGISVEVELSTEQLSGQILPGVPGRVTLESPDAPTLTVDVDDSGFFEFRKPPTGPLRLRVDAEGRQMATTWVSG